MIRDVADALATLPRLKKFILDTQHSPTQLIPLQVLPPLELLHITFHQLHTRDLFSPMSPLVGILRRSTGLRSLKLESRCIPISGVVPSPHISLGQNLRHLAPLPLENLSITSPILLDHLIVPHCCLLTSLIIEPCANSQSLSKLWRVMKGSPISLRTLRTPTSLDSVYELLQFLKSFKGLETLAVSTSACTKPAAQALYSEPILHHAATLVNFFLVSPYDDWRLHSLHALSQCNNLEQVGMGYMMPRFTWDSHHMVSTLLLCLDLVLFSRWGYQAFFHHRTLQVRVQISKASVSFHYWKPQDH